MFDFRNGPQLAGALAALGFIAPAVAAICTPTSAAERLVAPTARSFYVSHAARPFAAGAAVALSSQQQIALDGWGNLYVADSAAGNVVIYDSAHVQQTPRTISGLSNPVGVAVDPYGNTFVCNNGTNQILEFNAARTHPDIRKRVERADEQRGRRARRPLRREQQLHEPLRLSEERFPHAESTPSGDKSASFFHRHRVRAERQR